MLNEIEIKVLEKGLGFPSTPMRNVIHEEDLRRDSGEFSRKIRCNWYFRDEPSPDFSEVPPLRPKSNWKPPPEYPCIDLLLNKLELLLYRVLRKIDL